MPTPTFNIKGKALDVLGDVETPLVGLEFLLQSNAGRYLLPSEDNVALFEDYTCVVDEDGWINGPGGLDLPANTEDTNGKLQWYVSAVKPGYGLNRKRYPGWWFIAPDPDAEVTFGGVGVAKATSLAGSVRRGPMGPPGPPGGGEGGGGPAAWNTITGKPAVIAAGADQAAARAVINAQVADADLDALAALTAPATKLNGIATGATANDTDANLKNRANHTGSQNSSTISDFTEAVQDAVAAFLAQGTNVTLTYNDAGNTLTVAASGSGGLDAEAVRDAMGIAMVGSGLVSVTVNDAADTITITTTATANDTDANLKARANHTGTQSADTLTDGTTNKAFLATERTKLSGIATGATANSADATLLARANHTGTQSADTLTDGTTNKAFLATERTKLTGVATGATANDTDANLKNRANHTGSQAASTISDFNTAADARIAAASLYRPAGTDVAIADGGTGTSSLPTGVLVGAGTGAITAAPTAALNTVGIGNAVFIANGGTIPVGTPTYTIVIEMAP